MKNKKITIVSATPYEIAPFLSKLALEAIKKEHLFILGNLEIEVIFTGVGGFSMSYYLTKHLIKSPTSNLVINAGFGGAYSTNLNLGQVYQIKKDTFGDVGAVDIDGTYLSSFKLGFTDPNTPPFNDGWIINSSIIVDFLEEKIGLTVNTVTSEPNIIKRLNANFEADIESLEGAYFAYVCTQMQIPYAQIRSISNYVEPRNKMNWEIKKATEHLNEALFKLLTSI